MGLVRTVISLLLLVAFVVLGATVKIGKHTLFGHISRVWKSDEAQEMVKSVKEESGPAVERVKRGVRAGVEAATSDGGAAPADAAPTARASRDAGAGASGPPRKTGGKGKKKAAPKKKPLPPAAPPAAPQ